MSDIYLTNSQQEQSKFLQHPLINQSIAQAYQKLHKNIDEMQYKFQHIVSKQQSQFVFAYRSHITKIKKQLQEISRKSEEQQKMFSANDRIKFLEKQVAVFREQAIKVYDKLEKVTKELDIYKHKYEDTIKMYQLSQKSMKETMRQHKRMYSTHENHQQKLKSLEKRLQQKDQQIQSLKKQKPQQHPNKNQRLLVSIDSERTYRNRYGKLDTSGLQSTGRKSILLGDSFIIQNNLFKDLFFECVKSVKKQIRKRKNQSKVDFNNIQNLNQFREVDKIQVLTLLFSNQSIQTWLYQKLFPNNIFNKLENYTKNDQSTYQPTMKTTTVNFLLPKMREAYRKNASKMQYIQKSFL